ATGATDHQKDIGTVEPIARVPTRMMSYRKMGVRELLLSSTEKTEHAKVEHVQVTVRGGDKNEL
ncbi:MAG: hypothetical protein ACXVIZ_09360, partial [Halobacteriota archaeon]